MLIRRPATFLFLILALPFSSLVMAQQAPNVVGSFPKEGSENIIRNAFISVILKLPNGDIDPKTVSDETVRLYPAGHPEVSLPAFVMLKNDLRNITLEPHSLLDEASEYTFEITDKVKDKSGISMTPYQFTFSTGEVAFKKMITWNKDKPFGQSPYEAIAMEEETEEPSIEEEEILASAEPFETPAEKAANQPEPETPDPKPSMPMLAGIERNTGTGVRIEANNTAPPLHAESISPLFTEEEVLATYRPEKEVPQISGLSVKPASGSLAPPPAQAPNQVDVATLSEAELAEQREAMQLYEPTEFKLDPLYINPGFFQGENKLEPNYLPIPYYLEEQEYLISLEAITAMSEHLYEEEEEHPSADELPSDADLAGLSTTETEIKEGQAVSGVVTFPKGVIYKGQNFPIDFEFQEKEYVSFSLRTYAGTVVSKEAGFVKPGKNSRAVPMKGIKPGTYYAVVETSNQKVTRKVVILQ